ncbi:ribonuclease D [Candidatus Sumerlaeota bacterium]|nr:ribonuclease D [Candidatus Sumerlaeota bacterium]
MSQEIRPQWQYIQSDDALKAACRQLASAGRLAVDTEFIGEKYYYAKLELLQVSDGRDAFLIDVPALHDLQPLAQLLGNPAALKLFHASSQDLVILRRVLGVDALPLFDTQIAASLLGYGAQVSHMNLVREIAGADVSSPHTTSDWSHRPLTSGQLDYAANDVLYLHVIHDKLTEQLNARGRSTWMEGEMRDYTDHVFASEERDDGEVFRRVKDWMSLSGRDLAVLQELALWRENTAREQNLPRRLIMTDEGLVEMARFQPDSKEKAQKLRRANVGQIMRHFADLREAIRRGRALPKENWPRKPIAKKTEIPDGLIELALAVLRSEARRQDIAPTVLATTSELEQVIIQRSELKPEELPLLHGWRYDVAGKKILDLLEGRIALYLDRDGELQARSMP